MEDQSFLLGAIAVFASLTLATIIHAICRWAEISFAVGLLFGGLFFAKIIETLDLALFEHFRFSPAMVFFVFLPTLIFESAYHLNFRQFRGVLAEVATLATLGIFIAAGITGAILHYFVGWSWSVALLFGSLISATDPVAVLAIFREFRAPKKLSTIVDGESLLNDGTALVFFQFMKAIAISGAMILTPGTLLAETGNFFLSLAEGILVGIVLGFIFATAIRTAKNRGIQLTLSLILAHATFLFAEGILHVSGILATMAAGIVMGNFGKRKLEPRTRELFSEIWEFMGFISNALIFLLLGMKMTQIDFVQNWKIVALAAGIVIFIARPISVFASFFITNKFRKKDAKIPKSHQTITTLGGIRGVLAAAAVLLIPADFPLAEQFLAMTAGVILATFILNVPLVSLALRKFGLTAFSISEKIQQFEAEILIDEKVHDHLEKMKSRRYITREIFDELEKKYRKSEHRALEKLEKIRSHLAQKSDRELRKIASFHALGIEKKCYEELFQNHEISEKRFCVLIESIHRQTDRLRRDELPDERKSPAKYAPEISVHPPKFIDRLPNFAKNIARRKFKNFQKKQIHERVQHYRARQIASFKVILDFRRLAEHPEIFGNSKIIEKIIRRYEKWHQNAREKTEKLEMKFPKIVKSLQIRIATHSCHCLEKKAQKSFLEKEFISEKVAQKFENDLEIRIKKNLNGSRKFFGN